MCAPALEAGPCYSAPALHRLLWGKGPPGPDRAVESPVDSASALPPPPPPPSSLTSVPSGHATPSEPR